MNTLQPDTHLTEQEVEDFALGRVQRSRAPETLEHLLFCDECNERVESEQRLRDELREAMTTAEAPVSVEAPRRRWMDWFSAPNPAWAAAAACAVLLLFVPVLRQNSASTASAALQSYRGVSAESQAAIVPAGAKLDLTLSTEGLQSTASGKVAVVDALGQNVWSGDARTVDGVLRTHVDTTLQPGLYWVRLTRDEEPGKLAREYKLQVR